MRPIIDYGRDTIWTPVGQGYTGTYPPTPPVGITANAIVGVRRKYWTSPAPLGIPAGGRFGVRFRDEDADADAWQWVRDAFDIVPSGAGSASVIDREARFGVARSYEAIVYVYDSALDAWNGSTWSTPAAATLGPRNVWALTNPFDSTQGALVSVRDFDPAKPVKAGVFWPVNSQEAIVISDGAPKNASFTLSLWMKDRATRDAVEKMFAADVVLLLRDPFGRAYFAKVIGDISMPIVRAAPVAGEVTGIRDFHEWHAPMQSVRRPTAGPDFGPFADLT
jgi:hypothetical protein